MSSTPEASDAQLVLPSVQDMQSELRQSGILERSSVDEQPGGGNGDPTPTQGYNPALTPNVPADNVPLANTEINGEASLADSKPVVWLKHLLPKAIAIILMGQGLRGIYHSVTFIFVEFPMLEKALVNHEVTREQVNGYASKAIVTAISTIISMLFAMRLAFLHSKAGKIFHSVIGVAVVLSNQAIGTYFQQLDTGEIIATFSSSLLESVYILVKQFFHSFGL